MDSNLEGAIRAASEALLNMAEEARKLNDEMLHLRAQVERQNDFNQGLKQVFDKYYGGQG
jgi:hypothetical protein